MTGKFREPPTTRGLRSGTRLNGVYEIERLIGVGGMGEVYKGRVIQTGDAVAIKIIRPELAQNEDALALFRKEAAALHNLYHEAIVRYYLFSVDPDLGAPYLSMEYVDGQPLSEILKRGPLTLESTRILQRRLASGLQAAHNVGIVHRDVSPDNIILPSTDVARAKIVDFGIARSMLLGDSTVIGRGFAGKLSYVSPEQVGLYGGEVTPKSDIYSLGLVLAEAIIGRPLDMGGSQVDVVEKRRRVPDLSTVDRHLCPLLQSMLQPRPSDRIATMAEVAAWQEGNWSMSRKNGWPLLSDSFAQPDWQVVPCGGYLDCRPRSTRRLNSHHPKRHNQ
jgi:serine/threonine protein kinase